MADISKIKVINGTTYNIKDSGAFRKKAVVMSTNPFATPSDEHGSSALYIPKIDDALFCADKRFNVSVTGEYTYFNGITSLFNGSYDVNNLRIADDKSVTITFDFSNLSGQKFPGYPYGFVYLTFYASQNPKSLSGRVYNNYDSQGVGWHDVEFTNCFGGVWVGEQKYYGLQTLEITIVGKGTNSYGYTTLAEIDMHLTRPDPSNVPFVSKYSKQTLYYDLTAPKFIGSGESLTALNGSNISSGTVAADRIAALAASKITSGTFDAARIPNLDASKITSGTLGADRIPALGAAKITSGTFDAARIPSLNASKITDGTLGAERIPTLDAEKIGTGTLSADRLPESGVTAGSYGQAANTSPAFGGTFNVPYATVDEKGRVTAASTKTVTLPAYSTATSSANGLMSATDKSKLDNLTTIQLSSGISMTEGTDGLIFTYTT